MKTKLLKEVRKRFSIVRYDSLATNANTVEISAFRRYGFPFFVVEIDKEDGWPFCRFLFYGSYSESYESMQKEIHSCYFERFKHKDAKTTKLWWKK